MKACLSSLVMGVEALGEVRGFPCHHSSVSPFLGEGLSQLCACTWADGLEDWGKAGLRPWLHLL